MTTPTETADNQSLADLYEKTTRSFQNQSFVDEWNRTRPRMKEKESPKEIRVHLMLSKRKYQKIVAAWEQAVLGAMLRINQSISFLPEKDRKIQREARLKDWLKQNPQPEVVTQMGAIAEAIGLKPIPAESLEDALSKCDGAEETKAQSMELIKKLDSFREITATQDSPEKIRVLFLDHFAEFFRELGTNGTAESECEAMLDFAATILDAVTHNVEEMSDDRELTTKLRLEAQEDFIDSFVSEIRACSPKPSLREFPFPG